MGRPSSIKRLPPDIKQRLDSWIRDEAVTQAEAVERVNELLAELYPGHAPVSKSAVNRYDLSMREVGAKIREMREISEVWIAKLGSAPGGRTGHLITEMIRTMVCEIMQNLQKGELDADSMPAVIEQLKSLSLTAARVERASEISEKRERQIREAARKQALEDAAEAAAGEAAEKGLSADTAAAIKRQILGVSA